MVVQENKGIAVSSHVCCSALRCENDLVTVCSTSIQHSVDKSCSCTFKSNSISADVKGEKVSNPKQRGREKLFPTGFGGGKRLCALLWLHHWPSFVSVGPLIRTLDGDAGYAGPVWRLSNSMEIKYLDLQWQTDKCNILVMVVLGVNKERIFLLLRSTLWFLIKSPSVSDVGAESSALTESTTVHCRAFRQPRHRNTICYLIVLFVYINTVIFQGQKLPLPSKFDRFQPKTCSCKPGPSWTIELTLKYSCAAFLSPASLICLQDLVQTAAVKQAPVPVKAAGQEGVVSFLQLLFIKRRLNQVDTCENRSKSLNKSPDFYPVGHISPRFTSSRLFEPNHPAGRRQKFGTCKQKWDRLVKLLPSLRNGNQL